MSKKNRNGSLPTRRTGVNSSKHFGHYIIVTDGTVTEANYFSGIKKIVDDKISGHITLKIVKENTHKLLEKCKELRDTSPEYAQLWIVLDKDDVPDFDQLIKEAESSERIHIAWSNPCLEIWFLCYFKQFHYFESSKQCVREFDRYFEKYMKSHYSKSEKVTFKICQLLSTHGCSDKEAIQIAKDKYNQYLKNGTVLPSKMNPGTTVFQLIEELLSITD